MKRHLPRSLVAIAWTLALVLGVPSGESVAADGDAITATLAWEADNPVPALPGTLELSFARQERVAAPKDSGDVRYGVVPLPAAPGGVVAVAVDLAPGNERVWIDSDLDGQVSDERASEWHRSGLKWSAATTVRVRVGKSTVGVPVRVWRGAFRAEDEFLFSARAHRWGAARVGDALTMVSLEDVDGDLRFTREGGDRVYIDLNGDGRYDARPGSPELALPGGMIALGGVRRRIDVAPDGGTVRFVRDNSPLRPSLPVAGRAVARSTMSFDALFLKFDAERRLPAPERRAVLEEIGALGTNEALVMLDHVARTDFDLDARVIAAGALGNPLFVEKGATRVVSLAHSASTRVGAAALRALHAMGYPERAAVYADLVGSTQVPIVEEAARCLAAIDSSVARAAILRAVTERPEASLRLAAYRGARSGTLGVPAAARLAAATDIDATLRVLALADCLDSGDPRVRKLLHAAASDLSPRDDGRDLLPLLARGGDRECVNAIIRIGATRNAQPALELLVRMTDAITAQRLGVALDDGTTRERAFVAEALGLRGDPRAVGRLLARLEKEKEGFVRSALLVALGDLGETRTITSLARSTEEEGGGGPRALLTAIATPWVRGVPEAVSAFRVGLREEHWRMRELTLQTIAVVGETGVLRDVRDALRDSNRNVRTAAAAALGDVRDRDSVRPLLALLRTESSQKVRDAAGLSLFQLTGVNLYDDADLWKEWWAANGETFVVPAKMPALPAAAVAGTSAPEPPKFYGIPLDTESVVFVIDQSGSMSGGGGAFLRGGGGVGSKFNTAVTELLAAVKDLEDGSLVNVILFETGVRSWRQGLQKLGKGTRRSLRQYLMRLTPDGATNLYDAVDRGLRTQGAETIVVLSDGEPTHGRYTSSNEILSAVRDINERRGVVIHCVSIGGGSTLLRQLAAQNDGKYVTR